MKKLIMLGDLVLFFFNGILLMLVLVIGMFGVGFFVVIDGGVL